MKRPYIGKSIEDLEQLVVECRRDRLTLQKLQNELQHRNAKRSRRLLDDVTATLTGLANPAATDPASQGIGSVARQSRSYTAPTAWTSGRPGERQPDFDAEDDAKPLDDRRRPVQLSIMRRPGSSGLPDPWVPPLDQSLSLSTPPGTDLPALYIEALGELIAEIRRTGSGQKRYELKKGRRVASMGGVERMLYTFPFQDEAELFEEARVEVEVLGRRSHATVVSISDGKLMLALDEDVGDELDRATLVIDSTALLDALKERLESASKGEITLNKKLADAVVGRGEATATTEAIPAIAARDLNSAQDQAFRRALRDPVTYIWGPPGCGKTRTLAPLVRAAFEAGKRVLVCSNTNKAVDEVLHRICEYLGKQHEAMQQGHVLRLGRIADDGLRRDFEAYVTLEGIVERLSADLQNRRQALQESLARIDAQTDAAQRLVQLFDDLDAADRDVGSHQARTNELAREGEATREKLAIEQASLRKLEDELAGHGGRLFGLFKRKDTVIKADIERTRRHLRQLDADVTRQSGAYKSAGQALGAAQRRRDELRSRTAGKDPASLRRQLERADEERAPLLAEVRDIDAKLAEIRNAAMRNARIIGATCTKCYLSVKEIGQVDVVIVDEASMVMLPAVWFVVGMAKDRTVICGDFRQIPPIVSTRQQAISDAIGLDVFAAAGVDDPKSNRLAMLKEQHRMDDAICQLVSQPMYEGLLRTAADRPVQGHPPLPEPFDQRLVVVDTSDLWPFESVNAFHSRFNLMHALLVRNTVWHCRKRGYLCRADSLGICTPYSAQSRLIEALLEANDIDNVQVGTVHRFQGDERNAIILDIPESHGGRGLGQFVQGVAPKSTGARLINVALSRAKNHVLVFANITYLDKLLPGSSLLRDVLHAIQEKGRVVKSAEVLALRPLEADLQGLIGKVELDIEADKLGLFDQHNFDAAFEADLRAATGSIVILSGFITPRRVAKLGDLLRAKVAQGVKVRCITRPPHRNGSMDPALGKEALDMLEAIGCVVDCRAKVHEKIIIVDQNVVWHGSLNALSHAHLSDESMTRVANAGFARALAANIARRQHGPGKAAAVLTEAENPRCGRCGARSVYNESRFGGFFYCEEQCGWKGNSKSAGSGKAASGDQEESTSGERGKTPRCPECSGETHLRRGPYGEFFGCARYPRCTGKVDAAKPRASTRQGGRNSRARAGTHQ